MKGHSIHYDDITHNTLFDFAQIITFRIPLEGSIIKNFTHFISIPPM